jgi:glycosyltransferase involved in cell wall biosynthesis
MKIGIMGTRGIPNSYGGFEQFTQWLSVGLRQKGHEVFVYNSSLHPYKENEFKGVRIIHCRDKENIYGTFGQFIYDLNCIRDARTRKFDVLFHFGYSSDSFWWRRWPKDTVNIMNMDGLEWKRTKYNAITRKFLKWAELKAATKSQFLVADSLAMQEYVSTEYGKKPVFIPYGAIPFTSTGSDVPEKYKLVPDQYFLLIARMERENNIEMIIKGHLASQHKFPLLVIGDTSNMFGKFLVKKYNSPSIFYAGSIYNDHILNELRFHSAMYFHGHSVGGTNPSLLEAMACSCSIAAHDNHFNKAVLGAEAEWFSNESDISRIINDLPDQLSAKSRAELNLEKIKTKYDPEKIISAYEELASKAFR